MAPSSSSLLLAASVALAAPLGAAGVRNENEQQAAAVEAAADFYSPCEHKSSQRNCGSCLTGSPEHWRKRDLLPLMGPSYRCVWRHIDQEEYDFLGAKDQEEALAIIASDHDRWCPIAADMAKDWSGARMNSKPQFQCVEEAVSEPLGAFSAALPEGKKLSGDEKGKFSDLDENMPCKSSARAGEALLKACEEKDTNEKGEFVTISSCTKYAELVEQAWEESGELQEELDLPDISAAVRLANKRIRAEPASIKALERSKVARGLYHLCSTFGHGYMDSTTGKIFDHFPMSSELTGDSLSQASLIQRQFEKPWKHMVAVQAKEKFCRAQNPQKVCTSGLGGLKSELLCKAWVNCVCSGLDMETQEIDDVGAFLEDIPWMGGGAPWTWREGEGKAAFGRYKESPKYASQVIIEKNTGTLFLGDGHHRLMYAKDEGKRAWTYGKCE